MNLVIQADHPNYILERMRDVCAEKEGYKFRCSPRNFQNASEWGSVGCNLVTPRFTAFFNLQQCPGCCAVLIVSYVKFDQPKERTQENFDTVLQTIEDAAFRAGFGSVMMTQCVPQFSTMFWRHELWYNCLQHDWHATMTFLNGKSGNIVTYLTKDLGHKRKVQGLEFPVAQ